MPFDLPSIDRARGTFLPRRGSLVLDGAKGTIITVDRGCLWVTLERDPRDVVLTAGMRFRIDRSGRTVIAAEEDSCVRLIRAPSLLERVAVWLERARSKAIRDWSCRLSRRPVPYF
jgi:hypothetical protein